MAQPHDILKFWPEPHLADFDKSLMLLEACSLMVIQLLILAIKGVQ